LRGFGGLIGALLLVLGVAACGDEEVVDGDLTGEWLRASSVDSTRATFRADGTYEIVQTFNGDPFTPEVGTWALDGDHLVRESGEGALGQRNTDTFFVDGDRLVIGGVFRSTRSDGAAPRGEWEAIRGLEQVRDGGAWYRSSWSTKRLSLSEGGNGTIQSVTERDSPATGESEAPVTDNGVVRWSTASGVHTITGDLEGGFSVAGGHLVDFSNAYTRQ